MAQPAVTLEQCLLAAVMLRVPLRQDLHPSGGSCSDFQMSNTTLFFALAFPLQTGSESPTGTVQTTFPRQCWGRTLAARTPHPTGNLQVYSLCRFNRVILIHHHEPIKITNCSHKES